MPLTKEYSRRWVPALLLVSLCLRLLFIWKFYRYPTNIIDVDAHMTLGTAICERGEFSEIPGVPSLEAAPGFPLWIALLFYLFGKKPFLVLFFNALLSVATGAVAYLLGKRLFSQRVGLLTLAIWAVYPYSIYYCGWSYPETLTTFLVACELACLARWYRDRKTPWACVCGGLAALTALTNPASLVFLGLIPLGMAFTQRWRFVLRQCLFYYAILIVVYLPWPIRNYLAFGSPILTNIHGGLNLYQALIVPPDDFGTEAETKAYAGDEYYQQASKALQRHEDVSAYRLFMRGSLRLVLKDPRRYLRYSARRAIKMWRLIPYKRRYPLDYAKVFWVSLFSDGLLIPLGLLGMLALRSRWKDYFLLYAALGLWTLAYALVYVVMRFRMPMMVVVTLFAAAWLERRLPYFLDGTAGTTSKPV